VATPLDKQRDQQRFTYLLLASMIGYLAGIPFHLALADEVAKSPVDPAKMAESLVYSIAGGVLISTLAITVGQRTGRRVGLGSFMLSGWDDGSDRIDIARRTAAIALGVGALAGVLVVVLPMAMMPHQVPGQQIGMPAAWRGLLVSIRAGINEEILCRLGLMSLFAWLTMAVTRNKMPGVLAIWIANTLAALGFAALHLPQAAALYGLTPTIVVIAMLGNGLPGLIFGWLFWKRGLIAAMISHFGADLVVYVAFPLLGM
jgi:CAAX prenyl protease-like protein